MLSSLVLVGVSAVIVLAQEPQIGEVEFEPAHTLNLINVLHLMAKKDVANLLLGVREKHERVANPCRPVATDKAAAIANPEFKRHCLSTPCTLFELGHCQLGSIPYYH